MQHRIDQIYNEQSKDYIKVKKDKVKTYKTEKVNDLKTIVDEYLKIGGESTIRDYGSRLDNRIRELEAQHHSGNHLSAELMLKYKNYKIIKKEMHDVWKIIKMSDVDKIKHDYLSYRIKRLKDVYNKVQDFYNNQMQLAQLQ